MGLLIDGIWHDRWYDTASTGGRFERQESAFRNWVTPDGAPGPSGRGGFKAEAGRYHLYVSYACPWAHRTLVLRRLKGLENAVSLSVVNPLMGSEGWTFDDAPGVIADPIHDARHLYEVYLAADPRYTGRVTVPVLWDRASGTIVSNESAEILRMFDSGFADIADPEAPEYCPAALRGEIDRINAFVYERINNGVYKAGFATTQAAYDEAVQRLFEGLDTLDARLAEQRYLAGDRITEADWRLFTTLIRFDAVYVGHFKCNIRRLADYAHLWPYARELYQKPGVAETVRMDHIKGHYYRSHATINPTGIVPAGPEIDFARPHGRARIGSKAA